MIADDYTDLSDDESELDDPLDPLLAEGLIAQVLRTEKSGKEGTVYCCAGGETTGHHLIAVKVYRPRIHRTFKNDAVYRAGRPILNARDARAAQKKTAWGRTFSFGSWIHHEWETLVALHDLGADVPAPIKQVGSTILMEYIGDDEVAAPLLQKVDLDPPEARPLFERLLTNVEQMLAHNYVHGDLSAFNILYWEGRGRIIDFPQAVDPRENPHAFDLFARDVDRLCGYFSRYGIRTDPARIARHLWNRFLRAEL